MGRALPEGHRMSRRPLFPPEKWREIVELAAVEGPIIVAQRYGVNLGTLRHKMRALGVSRRAVNTATRREMVEYASEHGGRAAAEKYGTHIRTIYRWMKREGRALPPPTPAPPPAHGTYARYRHACRCQPCRDANTIRCRANLAKLARRAAAGDPAVPHGTPSGYTSWGCRCDECRAADKAARA